MQVWRAGKFYYQSTPSSGALPLMERTMNQRRRIIGRRRPGQGAMTGYCCMLVSCLLMWTRRSIYMHVVCFWHGIYKLLVQILVPISQKFIEKKMLVQWIHCICLSHILAKEFKMFFPFWKLHVIIHLFLACMAEFLFICSYHWNASLLVLSLVTLSFFMLSCL